MKKENQNTEKECASKNFDLFVQTYHKEISHSLEKIIYLLYKELPYNILIEELLDLNYLIGYVALEDMKEKQDCLIPLSPDKVQNILYDIKKIIYAIKPINCMIEQHKNDDRMQLIASI